ncbi:MAG: N-succinylarginine dihydrolase [Acidimicrobiia bacterium]|nr:N-succinylarginine dihydrolase [Acidimicrobiia bacterium]
MTVEANFDGLVGPTHNYGGLGSGNIASITNAQAISNPRQAALQGLAKSKALADRGLVQGILPPHERPYIPKLRQEGIGGSDEQVLFQAANRSPHLLQTYSSAAAMWTANAATVSPSADTADGKVHFTPANLVAQPHRAIEAPVTSRILRAIFSDEARFQHHLPLPVGTNFTDEGAANHTRLARSHGEPGIELFVWGRRAHDFTADPYLPRQTYEASVEVARLHGLTSPVFVRQHPAAIAAGVFHNDVIAVGDRDLLLHHELAFADPNVIEQLRAAFGNGLIVRTITQEQVPLSDAIGSYVFNSQLVDVKGRRVLVAPDDIDDYPNVREAVERIEEIDEILTFNLRQSMRNGGGPACLRLRVVLTDEELESVNRACLLSDERYDELTAWVNRHYRETLRPEDLGDPALLGESRAALAELTDILNLGNIYDFQRRE